MEGNMHGKWVSEMMGWRFVVETPELVFSTAAYYKPWVNGVEENLKDAIALMVRGQKTNLQQISTFEYRLPAVL